MALLRELSIFIDESGDRIVIYYNNGQKEITTLANSVFNAYLANIEVRRVIPSDYRLFQAADLCCTMALMEQKMMDSRIGLSSSERRFFSTEKHSAERVLKRYFIRTLDKKKLRPR